jgi:hypothetical protein
LTDRACWGIMQGRTPTKSVGIVSVNPSEEAWPSPTRH